MTGFVNLTYTCHKGMYELKLEAHTHNAGKDTLDRSHWKC
jgi:hypothetical protein